MRERRRDPLVDSWSDLDLSVSERRRLSCAHHASAALPCVLHKHSPADRLCEVAQMRVRPSAARWIRDLAPHPTPQPRQNPARDPNARRPAADLDYLRVALAPRGWRGGATPRRPTCLDARPRSGRRRTFRSPSTLRSRPQPRPLRDCYNTPACVGRSPRRWRGSPAARWDCDPFWNPPRSARPRRRPSSRRLVARARRSRQRRRAPATLARQHPGERPSQ